MNKFCPNCGREYSDELSACPYCSENGELQNDNVSDGADSSESGEINNETAVTQEFDSLSGEGNPYQGQNELDFNQSDASADFNSSMSPNGKKGLSRNAIIGVVAGAAVVVIVAIILLVVFVFGNNNDGGSSSQINNGTSATEDLTMPSGYESIIEDIEDEDGNIITQATDPYGNTITREVDEDGNVTTTFVGPDGTVSTVTTDRDGNIISYDIPSSSSNGGTSSTSSSNNNSSQNNNSSNSSNNNSSSQSSSSSNSSSSSSSSTSSENTSSSGQSSDGSVTINGKKYMPGDTVTMRMTVQGINELVAGFQFKIDYDSNLLELDKDSVTPYNTSCILNTNIDGTILLNCISASFGVDFSSEAQVVECKFTVKESTSTACDITVNIDESEIYTGVGTQEIVDVTDQAEINVEVE